jgi:catechol 2,3-dioxygenase-like lactoylglutathione lyase family enzyme
VIRTFGLTHISLAVNDPERSLKFYEEVFGVTEYFRDESSIQAIGPSGKDILAFEKHPEKAGQNGGIQHFGFRLLDPKDIDTAIVSVEAAGGKLLRRGEFAPGFPYAYVSDPDNYEIEIWFE